MKHSHYFKPVPAGVTHVDVYRVLQMFEVTCPALQHAAKKILVAGGRGAKDARKDIQEAIDTLQRKLVMLDEDAVPVGRVAAPALVADDDAGGWIEWRGGQCPVPDTTTVEVRFRSGAVAARLPSSAYRWVWARSFVDGGQQESLDIIAYRIVPRP